ncbi:SH3 domain-containing kinase-binding protein 1 [Liparis tanakae]|uniref:Osteoclast-stimulating factor 1 n=1 Tax=Liparis tanakae TaxID=230148 RepID=A0A4Z2FVU4_9TELE|nr:SH3 domain-containing kinase-binding protein 1 [Liparis tanakae]
MHRKMAVMDVSLSLEAVVEFDYEAQQDDELGLAVGDIIVNIRRDDGGWWEGELGGRRGLFPDNFVREIKKEGKRDGGQASMIRSDLSNGRASPVSDASVRSGRKVEQIRKRRCKAAFSYAPQHEDELELKIGDVVEIISEVEEGWWEGFLNGKTGMFPSNFTKVVQAESETSSLDTSQEELRSNRTILVRGFGFGDIFKDQPIRLRPRSMDSSLSSLDLDSPAAMDRKEKEKEEPEPEPAPQRPAEVSLRRGLPSVSVADSRAPLPARPSVLIPPSAGHRPTSPSSSPGLSPSPELRHSPLTPPTLEELRNQLRDLRSSVELLKNQHRQDMKHLTNALDDERKIRVSLQMEVEHIKKSLSK